MTDAAAPAEPAPHDLRAVRAARRLQRLDELADMGVDIAAELRRQVLEGAEAAPELSLAFDRVCRAVRLTQMLQEKLEQDGEARARSLAAEREARVARKVEAVRTTVRGVLDVETEADGTLDDCALHGLMLDRADREAGDARFLDRPLGEIVARICFDLGLQPDWSLWAGAACADAADTQAPAEPRHPPRLPNPPDPDEDPQGFVDDVLRRMALDRAPP